MALEDPIIRAAAGLDPRVEPTLAAQNVALLAIPEFNTDFKSESFPSMDGPVTIRYATVGDSLAIENLIGARGGFVAEAIASLHVLVTKAPASWWQIPEGGSTPLLNLNRLPDVEALLALYQNYSKWRASFRSVSTAG